MNTNQCDIGLIGLGVMGENLVLNMESKGFSVAVFNRTTEVTEKFAAERAQGKNIQATQTLEEFVGALKKPRIAMMMVKAGSPVDSVIGQLAPLLEKGDVIIDGGNSLFTDTQRRERELQSTGIHFVGIGVSGGEEGALNGPSLMPGGSRESWDIIAPIFRKIAAQVDGEPCCRYMGPDGAGHFGGAPVLRRPDHTTSDQGQDGDDRPDTHGTPDHAVACGAVDVVAVVGRPTPLAVWEPLGPPGALEPRVAERLARYREGVDLYRARKWEEAARVLGDLARETPGDGPTVLYAQRSREALEHPPPPDWDGVHVARTK